MVGFLATIRTLDCSPIRGIALHCIMQRSQDIKRARVSSSALSNRYRTGGGTLNLIISVRCVRDKSANDWVLMHHDRRLRPPFVVQSRRGVALQARQPGTRIWTSLSCLDESSKLVVICCVDNVQLTPQETPEPFQHDTDTTALTAVAVCKVRQGTPALCDHHNTRPGYACVTAIAFVDCVSVTRQRRGSDSEAG